MVAGSALESRIEVFARQAKELVRWITVGKLEESTVVSRLLAVGEEFGLNRNDVRNAIEAALADPLEPPSRPTARFDRGNQPSAEEATGKVSQRDKLVVVSDLATFWRCPDGVAHASVPVEGRVEHHRVRSEGFRNWLMREAGAAYPNVIAGKERPGTFGRTAIEEALACCEAATARVDDIHPARIRVADTKQALYIDLGDSDWRAVEIGGGNWRIVDRAPVPILRTKRTRSLAEPSREGSLDPLRCLLPLNGDDEFRLVVLWLLAALRASGPYPILALSGEAGSGKSLMARLLRKLVDPSGDNIMQPPRNDRDLIAAAKGNHVLAFDNLSAMPGDLADSMCRLATGGDIGGRMLYTDADSAAFAAQRPIIINGIPDLVTRGDLASRALFIRLAPMQRRRTEAEMRAEFEAVAPRVLGALLDTLAAALADLPNRSLPTAGANLRMADFALLAIAAERPLGWPEGTGLRLLQSNAVSSTAVVLETDSVASAIRWFVENDGPFTGLVSELYRKLCTLVDQESRRAPSWPKDAARFGEHLRRIAPALRQSGINVEERRVQAGMQVALSFS
jgi:hypothetical protein